MKKQMNRVSLAVLGAIMLVTPVMAADYSNMTTEELSALRGTRSHATVEEQAAFQQEWQERLQQMTPEERQQFTGKPANPHISPATCCEAGKHWVSSVGVSLWSLTFVCKLNPWETLSFT